MQIQPHRTSHTTAQQVIYAYLLQAASGLQRSGLAAFGIPFFIYTLTLAPTIYNLDSAELTTAVATGGILRATGYPLYLMLGKLWSLIPVGDLGYRMNLFSAFWGAVTVFLGDRILRRLEVGPWARFGALGLLATAPYFWSLSLIAEVYTLHTALMAGILLALMRWGARPSRLRLGACSFLLAISLGNHAATTLLIPGFLWYLLASHPRELLRRRMVAYALTAALLGASVFLYLPIRYGASPAFNYAGHYDATGVFHPVDLQTLDGFLWLVTGRTFAGQMFGYGWGDLWPQVEHFVGQLWLAFAAVGLAPAVLGFGVLLRKRWRLGSTLGWMFLANAVFFIAYRVMDKETMYLPLYLIWALCLAVGYQFLLDWIRKERIPRLVRALVYSVVVGAVLIAGGLNRGRVDLSNDYSTREQSEAILHNAAPGAIILGWWDTIPAIQYLQLVEGQRPDVVAINRFLISGEDMNRLVLQEMDRRPIYINNPSVALLRTTRAVKIGPIYRLEARHPLLP